MRPSRFRSARWVSGAIAVCAALLLGVRLIAVGTPSVRAQDFSTNTPVPPPAFPTNTNAPSLTPIPATEMPSATPTASPTPSPSPTATATPTFTPSPTPTVVGPAQYPDGFNPLTGLPYPDQAAADRRNLLVKISNYPPIVRPQSGINAADVVYEYEVEGGVTRLAAIYRSQTPSRVGPVRSGRLTDLELVPMYQALFAYSGASDPVTALFRQTDWWRLNAISPSRGDNCEEAGFCRVEREGVAFEHTLYLDTNQAWARATARGVNTGYRARGLAFSDVPDAGGTNVSAVKIEYYGQLTADWLYQPETARYVRYTDGLAHFDAAENEQLWADNVVIIEAEHIDRPDLFEPESRSASHHIALWGTGRAILLRDGMSYEGYWERACDFRTYPEATATPTPPPEAPPRDCYANAGTALRLFYGDNTPMMMQPGRTWVMVTRWLNYVTLEETAPDLQATSDVITQTPTVTPWGRPEATWTPTAGA
jgi:hypothetical protein